MSQKIIVLSMITLMALAACNTPATPEAPPQPAAVVETPTSAPTVVLPTAAPYGQFIGGAQPGGGLARVKDHRPRAGHGLHKAVGQRGNA